jgi:hypothetical protein
MSRHQWQQSFRFVAVAVVVFVCILLLLPHAITSSVHNYLTMSQQDLVAEIQQTLVWHKEGRVLEAITGYERVLPLIGAGSTKLSLLGNVGALLMSQGDFNRARHHFTTAIELAPDNAQAQFNLAVLLTSKLNLHANALKHCALAIRLDKGNHKAYHLMGNIMQSLGKEPEAEKYFQLAESLAGETAQSPINETNSSELAIHRVIKFIQNRFENEWTDITHDGNSYRVRLVSREPLAFTVDNFISPDQCQHIKDLSTPMLEKSFVMGNKVTTIEGEAANVTTIETGVGEDPSLYRSSYNTWLPQDSVLSDIQEKLSSLLGIPLGYVKHKSEDLQVVKYNLGGQFKAHQDSSAFHSRLLTALMYLEDLSSQDMEMDFRGGATWFPFAASRENNQSVLSVENAVLSALNIYDNTEIKNDLPGIQVQPKKGSILVFFNYDANGSIDPLAVHAGLPIQRRSATDTILTESTPMKWIANYWLDYDEAVLRSYC